MKTRKEIFALIDEERKRQNIKWGQQAHDKGWWFIILSEEIGEIAKAIYERDDFNYRDELIQSTSVLVAMLESYFNNGRTLEDISDRIVTKP